MHEPVLWLDDGSPHSPRFDDRYRSRYGGLAQSQGVYLAGCDLPTAWQGRPAFTVLETGFGLGLNFLATWAAWAQDAARSGHLHFVSVEAYPVSAQDILRNAQQIAAAEPDAAQREQLLELSSALAQAWHGLVPGVHRLRFAAGRVTLTLSIGEVQPALKALVCEADAVYLDGFDPERNPEMWSLDTLKAISRHCRVGTLVASYSVALAVRERLQQLGFEVHKRPGVPPKRHRLQARFAPHWPLRRQPRLATPAGQAIVIGAGLSGAAVAWQLAEHGWAVRVLDQADAPASGASALPVGLMSTHVSPDDAPLSRASRAGVRASLHALQMLAVQGQDWQATGALEQGRASAKNQWPAAWAPEAAADWFSRTPAGLHHLAAAWIKPAALVRAWLAHPGITWQGGARVHSLREAAGLWQLLDANSQSLGTAPLVVVCTAYGLRELLPSAQTQEQTQAQDLPLDLVAGQVALGADPGGLPTPLNGNGHLVPAVPLQGQDGERFWLSGSTYERRPLGELDPVTGLEANRVRLEKLLADWPHASAAIQFQFAQGAVRHWRGERCTSIDRLPLVGEWLPGLLVSAAMGSRGLCFAALCAELLVAQLCAEPLPLDARLAQALAAQRFAPGGPRP